MYYILTVSLTGAECSVQIGSTIPPNSALPDLNANVIGTGDGGSRQPMTRVTRGVQTLPRSATKASSATSRQSALVSGATAGGSLTRPQRVCRLPIVDSHVRLSRPLSVSLYLSFLSFRTCSERSLLDETLFNFEVTSEIQRMSSFILGPVLPLFGIHFHRFAPTCRSP